jgi:hypothetical protein
MLNNVAPTERAIGAGACPSAGMQAIAAALPGVKAPSPRRRRVAWTAAFGPGIAAAQVKALGQAYVRNQHPQTTRFAAVSKGGVGPHPARDPV